MSWLSSAGWLWRCIRLEPRGEIPEPFGGTITHHRMPPNTVAARVAYLWRGKDKPAFWVYIGGMTPRCTSHRRASLTGVHLIGVHPRRASLTGVHLMRASHRRVSLTGVHLLQACILWVSGLLSL